MHSLAQLALLPFLRQYWPLTELHNFLSPINEPIIIGGSIVLSRVITHNWRHCSTVSRSLSCFVVRERQRQILRNKHSVVFSFVVSFKFKTNSIGPSWLLQFNPKFSCTLTQYSVEQLPRLNRHLHSLHLSFSGGRSGGQFAHRLSYY